MGVGVRVRVLHMGNVRVTVGVVFNTVPKYSQKQKLRFTLYFTLEATLAALENIIFEKSLIFKHICNYGKIAQFLSKKVSPTKRRKLR